MVSVVDRSPTTLYPVRFPAHFVETGVLDQVAGKEHAGLDALALQVADDPVAGETASLAHGQQEAEPGRVGVSRWLRAG